jgi:hypothetical protein
MQRKKKVCDFPVRESLVSDIPAGDRKIVNLFFTVYEHKLISKCCLFPVSAFFSFQNCAGNDNPAGQSLSFFWAKLV